MESEITYKKDRFSLKKGQTLLTVVLLFLIITMTIAFGVASPVVRSIDEARLLVRAKKSFYSAQGGNEDAVYRLMHGMEIDLIEKVNLNGSTTTTALSSDGDKTTVLSRSEGRRSRRNIETVLLLGDGASFNFGVQSGEGGLHMYNSSTVNGNAFSNGPIVGQNQNVIGGEAISAGTSGYIEDIHATSSAYANTITDSFIDKDAYYKSISSTTVLGDLNPDSPDQATSSLPLADDQIDEWKSDAQAGGIISSPCPYEINSDTAIGPVKIACDLEIKGTNFEVTLQGPVWVEGNIIMRNSPDIVVDSAMSGESIPIIADNPADPQNSGTITLENSPEFIGAPGNSFILLVSQNTSAENGGPVIGIDVANSTTGELLVYSGHGAITLRNSVDLKEVTAYKIITRNTATVTYETGLASLLFTAGPGGGFVFDSWREVE